MAEMVARGGVVGQGKLRSDANVREFGNVAAGHDHLVVGEAGVA